MRGHVRLERQLAALRGALLSTQNLAGGSQDESDAKLSRWMSVEAARLRAEPPEKFSFSEANLGDMIRFTAMQAGMEFMMPDDVAKRLNQQQYSCSMNASPFSALEQMAGAAGMRVEFDQGVWHLTRGENAQNR